MSHCMHVTAHLLQIVYRYVVLHSDDVQLSPCHSTFTSCTTVCKSYHIVTSCTIVCHTTPTRCPTVCMTHHTHKMSNCLYVIACSHKLYNYKSHHTQTMSNCMSLHTHKMPISQDVQMSVCHCTLTRYTTVIYHTMHAVL